MPQLKLKNLSFSYLFSIIGKTTLPPLGDSIIFRSEQRICPRKDIVTAVTENFDCLLEIDGGINSETSKLAIEAGCDVLVAGSAVFGAADAGTAINNLKGT